MILNQIGHLQNFLYSWCRPDSNSLADADPAGALHPDSGLGAVGGVVFAAVDVGGGSEPDEPELGRVGPVLARDAPEKQGITGSDKYLNFPPKKYVKPQKYLDPF